jgi:cyclic pyranopterin phosphate synthase
MPAEQVPEGYGFDATSRLSFDEIETLVRGFVRRGVSKLRLTGRRTAAAQALPELVARLARIEG